METASEEAKHLFQVLSRDDCNPIVSGKNLDEK